MTCRSEEMCGKCGLPIHPGETGLRHFGTFTAHSEDRCVWLLQDRIRQLSGEIEDAKVDLDAYIEALVQCYGEGMGDGSEETLVCGIQRLQRLAGQGIALRTVFGRRVWDLDDEQTAEFCRQLEAAEQKLADLARPDSPSPGTHDASAIPNIGDGKKQSAEEG